MTPKEVEEFYKKNQVVKTNFNISDNKAEIIFAILKENKNVTANQIAQVLNISVANIVGFLKLRKIKIRRY